MNIYNNNQQHNVYSIYDRLSALTSLRKRDRDQGIQLLLKIFKNIIDNPTDEKYQNLNYLKVRKKLAQCDTFLPILYDVGFYQSNQRLLFNMYRLEQLKSLNDALLAFNSTFEVTSIIPNANLDELIARQLSLGFSISSIDDQDTIACSMDALPNITEISNSWSKCGNNVARCNAFNQLSEVINKYNDSDPETRKQIVNNHYSQIRNILNAFNHLLLRHDKNEEFDYIYNLFGGLCNTNNCNIIQRHHRMENQSINYDKNELLVESILDKIHSHFNHGYDIGSRLTKDERKHYDCLPELRNVLSKKRLLFQTLTKTKYNKFSSDLNQTKMSDDCKQNDIITYSYSYPFNYWSHCKDCQDIGFVNMKYKDLYIYPKYNTLKEELTNNKIHSISTEYWDTEMMKAIIYQDIECGRKCIARIHNYLPSLKYTADHPSKFGFKEGEQISQEHLVAIILYCGNNELQYKFSETYRGNNNINDDLDSIKENHSNYHHLGKTLKETVEVFGIEYKNGKVETVYHGINREMIFNGTQCEIYSVLSTTSSWTVAVQFSGNIGIILELVPSTGLKYFNCCWLSKYPYEAELLFIGGFQLINVMNITHAIQCRDYKQFVTAVRIIENMTNDTYFKQDPSIIHLIHSKGTKNIKSLGLTDMSSSMKRLTKQLICHELHKYLPNKYSVFDNLDEYIDKLLHQVCLNKQNLKVNWNTMNIDVLKQYDIENGGYVGYKFLKAMFCNDKYEGIKIGVFNILFPRLNNVIISNLSSVDSNFLNEIIQFLKRNKSTKIQYWNLYVARRYGVSNIMEQIGKYEINFKDIGYIIGHRKHPGRGTHVMVIQKHLS